MSLQNRVDPFGEIHAVPERGTLFGNRGGCFHDSQQQLRGRHWVSRRWITCLLRYKGWHREVMTPNRYTELFFLDEATAFAAGHRPCMLCRRTNADRFIDAWSRAHLPAGQRVRTVDHIDEIAHGERIDARARHQRTTRVQLATLPDGALVTRDEAPEQPLLLWQGRLHQWSFGGYTGSVPKPTDAAVTLLTPPSFAFAFAAGYAPAVHDSAG